MAEVRGCPRLSAVVRGHPQSLAAAVGEGDHGPRMRHREKVSSIHDCDTGWGRGAGSAALGEGGQVLRSVAAELGKVTVVRRYGTGRK